MAGYWQNELDRFKIAYAKKNIDAFFINSTTNSREMKTVYTNLGSISKFIEWLEYKAAEEAEGNSTSGTIYMSVGGF